jgi:hypothetical protein
VCQFLEHRELVALATVQFKHGIAQMGFIRRRFTTSRAAIFSATRTVLPCPDTLQ